MVGLVPRADSRVWQSPVGSPCASLAPGAGARNCGMSSDPGGVAIRGQLGNSMVDILCSVATACGARRTSSLTRPVLIQTGHGNFTGSGGWVTSVSMALVCTGPSRAGWFQDG